MIPPPDMPTQVLALSCLVALENAPMPAAARRAGWDAVEAGKPWSEVADAIISESRRPPTTATETSALHVAATRVVQGLPELSSRRSKTMREEGLYSLVYESLQEVLGEDGGRMAGDSTVQ